MTIYLNKNEIEAIRQYMNSSIDADRDFIKSYEDREDVSHVKKSLKGWLSLKKKLRGKFK